MVGDFQNRLPHCAEVRNLTLEIPRSKIGDCREDLAQRLPKNCETLVILQQVVHPIDVIGKVCQNDEAHASASKMPKLRHIEIGNMLIKTKLLSRSPLSAMTSST
ncbi:hypothetical protein VPH35_047762 [Triticum aestivum]